MRIKILALAACLLIPFQLATAAPDKPAQNADPSINILNLLNAAIDDGATIQDATNQLIASHPTKLAEIVEAAVRKSNEDAVQIMTAAIAVQCGKISDAVKKAKCAAIITQAGLAGGATIAQLSLVTGSTAAGGTNIGTPANGNQRSGSNCRNTASCS